MVLSADPFEAFVAEIIILFSGFMGLIRFIIVLFMLLALIRTALRAVQGKYQDGMMYFILVLLLATILAAMTE